MKLKNMIPMLLSPMIAAFLMGCVHVIVPINPEAAGVKTPASTVAVEFRNENRILILDENGIHHLPLPPKAAMAYTNLQRQIVFALYEEGLSVAYDVPRWEEFLQKAPAPRRNPKPPIVDKSACDVRLVVGLTDYKKGYFTLTDVWGNVVQRGECINMLDCVVHFLNNKTGQEFGEITWSFPNGIQMQRSIGLAYFVKKKLSQPSK
jgi:hypothetical protein